jgi:hypothetical protein
MAEPSDSLEKVYAEVNKVNAGEGKEFKLVHKYDHFLGGELYVVAFKWQDKQVENYAYVKASGIYIAKNQRGIIDLATRFGEDVSIRGALVRLINVTNLIGLAFTALVIYLVGVKGSTEVPAIVTAALGSVLGFYFGTQKTGKG